VLAVLDRRAHRRSLFEVVGAELTSGISNCHRHYRSRLLRDHASHIARIRAGTLHKAAIIPDTNETVANKFRVERSLG
jgi:hypothetical protein